MTKDKIGHPYLVPDDFFEEFNLQMEEKLTVPEEKSIERLKLVLLVSFKYAAIIALSFFVGRESILVFNPEPSTSDQLEYFSVDAVYNQISDDEITDYIIQNTSPEELKQLNFYR